MPNPTKNDSYALLDRKLKRIHVIGSVSSLLGWDEQVNLPPASQGHRQDQSATLSSLEHEAATDTEIGLLLAKLETNPLHGDQAIVVREARRAYDRAIKLPAEWVESHARLCSEAYHAWAAARATGNFAAYAPYLQRHLDSAKQRADYLGWGDRLYDLMIDLHDPGMEAETIATLFDELKAGLAPLARKIVEAAENQPTIQLKGYDIGSQRAFLREVTAAIGFDYQRGRIDESLHPFCSGNGADIRMTTRFDPDNPLDSLFSSIHEAGHGIYEQGLPLDQLHTALGQAAGMGVHESQSRLWENQVCRGRSFWKHFEPKFRQAFPQQTGALDGETLYRAINAVGRTLIRVDADEMTYNLHIIIRFEVEKRLFDGSLAIAELPDFWNAQYRSILGIEPTHDGEGVLQDVHWSGGAFGYFPSYTLGNMLAAQLWYAAQEQIPNLENDFAHGDFAGLLAWLRREVHQRGARYRLPELALKATGQALSPRPLLRYLEERYLPLYNA